MRSHSEPGPFLRPVRVTITVPYNAYQALVERSNVQGRSLSNLAAYLLESALQSGPASEHNQGRTESAEAYRRRA
jgi:CopG-like RHH_1 or ribbon-helix-helix domain, RHH_5